MYQKYRELKRKREAGEIDGGFTLIELLIVIVVLGILAAIVVFALGSVTKKSAVAACQSDAKTVDVGASALLAENPTYSATSAEFQAHMLPGATTSLTGAPFVKSWPNSTSYQVFVWGSNNVGLTTAPTVYAPAGTTLGTTGIAPQLGDVIVTGPTGGTGNQAKYYDASQSPTEACAFAVTGKG